MAKRRKLEAPSVEDLGKIEEEFRRETPSKPAAAPIAQVAADVAGQFQTGTAEMRRDEAQAAAYRKAEGKGLLIETIALEEIEEMSIQRDRTMVDAEALAELEHSIEAHGLRLPIEIHHLSQPQDGKRYGLLSGYRRLIAQRNLFARTRDSRFARINAVIRDPDQMGGAFVAMVEENEIRQDLSHYERGRIAAIAAQQGAFPSTEAAVSEMFSAASKAKRSKIRSFAMIFEELGDMLQFPEALREKDGLRLAKGLRGGAATELRKALANGHNSDPKTEWALIEAVLAGQGDRGTDPKRGGRPKAKSPKSGWQGDNILYTSTGVMMRRETYPGGQILRFSGDGVSSELIGTLMVEIKERLETD